MHQDRLEYWHFKYRTNKVDHVNIEKLSMVLPIQKKSVKFIFIFKNDLVI